MRCVTLGMASGWTLFSALQRIMPFLSPSCNSSSEGSSGRSLAHTTPTVFRNQLAASCLLIAALTKRGNKCTFLLHTVIITDRDALEIYRFSGNNKARLKFPWWSSNPTKSSCQIPFYLTLIWYAWCYLTTVSYSHASIVFVRMCVIKNHSSISPKKGKK